MGVSSTELEVLMKLRAEGADATDLFNGTLKKTETTAAATAKELDKVDASLKQLAADARSGASLQDIEQAAKVATNELSNLGPHGSAALESVRTASGGARAGLNSMAEAAGFTYGELGLLNSAGMVLGAGMAGWGIGRQIAEFLGLDEAIARVTASLTGMGNVARQESGAVEDSIRTARERGAKIPEASSVTPNPLAMFASRVIDPFDIAGFRLRTRDQLQNLVNDARQFNDTWKKDLDQWGKSWDDAVARVQAPQLLANKVAEWHGEIQKVRAAGTLDNLKADIASHSFSIKELADRYRIMPEAIAQFSRELAIEEKAQKAAEAASKRSSATKKAEEEAIARVHERIRQLEVITPGLRQQVGVLNDTEQKAVQVWLAKQAAGEALYATMRKLQDVKVGHVDVEFLPGDRTNEIGGLRGRFSAQDEADRARAKQFQQTQNALSLLSGTVGQLGSMSSGAAAQILAAASQAINGLSGFRDSINTVGASSLSTALAAFQLGMAIGQLAAKLFAWLASLPGALTGIAKQAADKAAKKLPRFAAGGYVPHPTLAIVGDAPGGEYIIPARHLTPAIQSFADQDRAARASSSGQARAAFGALRDSPGTSAPGGPPVFNFNFHVDARGALLGDYGLQQLGEQLQQYIWRAVYYNVSTSAGNAGAMARAALRLPV